MVSDQNMSLNQSTLRHRDREGEMLKRHALQERGYFPTVRLACFLDCMILATLLTLLLSDPSHGQTDSGTITLNIPAQAVPQALNEFARQARVELIFAERGFDSVQANAVVGTYEKRHALQLLLAGTGLQVNDGSDDSVIVQRGQDTSVVPVGSTVANDPALLLAQAAGHSAQSTDRASGDLSGSQNQSDLTTRSRDNTEAAQPIEEIFVTGSRIRGAQNASPVFTISWQEIDQAGFATVEEVVENLPQNFRAGATSDATQADNKLQAVGRDVRDFSGGTSVNLRGLGASSTLVLLNGRSTSPSSSAASFTNISSIPITAIERVEVMTDGASAIYGSDAIGGVINFILRESYDGAETRLRYGSDAGGDTSSVQFGQSFGTSWDSGSILLSYEYHKHDNLANRDRGFASQNLTKTRITFRWHGLCRQVQQESFLMYCLKVVILLITLCLLPKSRMKCSIRLD